jgi:pimeloyl-ACP methyl ester carboxylesterase
VRTAFPSTGGFDEHVTLFCLHPQDGSSRTFARFLPEIATGRSVYAPDLPGFGESDPAPSFGPADAARAISDLASDLRLRQIDLLGMGFGAAVAVELAAARPELVRRVVLTRLAPVDPLPAMKQECLILRLKLGAVDDAAWSKAALPHARFVELAEYAEDLFDAAPKTLAKHVHAFLGA